jgi:hypothetical protein
MVSSILKNGPLKFKMIVIMIAIINCFIDLNPLQMMREVIMKYSLTEDDLLHKLRRNALMKP